MLDGTLVTLIADVPTWVVALVLTVAAEIFAVGLMLLTRAISGVDRLKQNNEVAGFKFAVIGVFYGVLLAFVVVSVWEEYRGTQTAVRNEAKAIIDLYHVSAALPFEAGVEIRHLLFTYTDHVCKYEWRTMARGRSSEDAGSDLESLSSAIFELEPQGYRQLMLYQAALRLLAVIADNRSERLDSADGSMSGLLWFVLIVGAGVTLGYPAFFGASNLMAQTLMTAALAALVALSLLLAVAFDYPFTGAVRISPQPFDKALEEMPPDVPSH
jgi:hypothetical protein